MTILAILGLYVFICSGIMFIFLLKEDMQIFDIRLADLLSILFMSVMIGYVSLPFIIISWIDEKLNIRERISNFGKIVIIKKRSNT